MKAEASSAQDVGVVILAAGRSRRMGRPKLLLPWGATSVLGHQIGVWQNLGVGQIGVVCADDPAMRAELDQLGFPPDQRILNPQPERGMFSSILCAAKWRGWDEGLTHWAISLGDQPHLRWETLRMLLEFSASHPTAICQPLMADRLRHPVILPKQDFERLAVSTAPTLKEFLLGLPVGAAGCAVDDPGLCVDLDTPADYDRALALRFGTA